MGTTWQLQDAKNRLSEVVEKAQTVGPQEITRRGQPMVVVLSVRDYQKLKGRRGTLAQFLHCSPLAGVDITRARDLPREVRL